MYSIYWNGECISSGYEDRNIAFQAIKNIISRNNGTIMAVDKDCNNEWYLVRFVDECGFPCYDAISLIDDTYKIF